MRTNSISLCCIFLICHISISQELAREMISSQGASVQVESGHYVTQTIGQLSLTGSSYGDEIKVIQGFQQPYWNKLIASSEVSEPINISFYPNPVIRNLNFNFSNYNDGVINVMIFDFAGRNIMNQSALKPFRDIEIQPGKDIQSDDEIDNFIKHSVESAYHPCCSCKMGSDNDSVVDNQTRVFGLSGLRVVDASIFPDILNGNLNAPTMMVAEKVADMILKKPPPR